MDRIRFKGYRDFVVQDLVIESRNTRYRLARWETPDGQTLIGQLPQAVQGGHFGPMLASYVLYQHHHCHVTQPLLCEQLREWGIEISSGQVNALLQVGKERFHAEKDGLLSTGLALSAYVTVDDTGARHQGKNGYVTHIGNEHFAWFQSTRSKSRINFLELRVRAIVITRSTKTRSRT
ncbi:transposase [Paraburkholderia xenovorans]